MSPWPAQELERQLPGGNLNSSLAKCRKAMRRPAVNVGQGSCSFPNVPKRSKQMKRQGRVERKGRPGPKAPTVRPNRGCGLSVDGQPSMDDPLALAIFPAMHKGHVLGSKQSSDRLADEITAIAPEAIVHLTAADMLHCWLCRVRKLASMAIWFLGRSCLLGAFNSLCIALHSE